MRKLDNYETGIYTDNPDDTLRYMKSVEVVDVVRCKDCKHWDGVPADETQDHECHLFDGNEEKIRIATPSYWFCPMGERRSE